MTVRSTVWQIQSGTVKMDDDLSRKCTEDDKKIGSLWRRKKYLYNLMDIDMVKQEVIKTWLTKAKLTYLQV